MEKFSRIKIPFILVSVLLLIIGCAGRQKFKKIDVPEGYMQSYLADKPAKLRPGFRAMLEDGKRNYVLNNMRVGTDALMLGYREIAKKVF